MKFLCFTNVCVLWPLRASFALMLGRWLGLFLRRATVAEMTVCVAFGARRSEATLGICLYQKSDVFYNISGRSGAEMTLYVSFGACWLYGLVARQGVPWRQGGDLEVRANLQHDSLKNIENYAPVHKTGSRARTRVAKKTPGRFHQTLRFHYLVQPRPCRLFCF